MINKLFLLLAPLLVTCIFASNPFEQMERFSKLYEVEDSQRKKMQNIKRLIDHAKMCQLAYDSDNAIRREYPDALIFNTKKTKVKAFLIFDDENKHQTIVIRGSINFKNWVANVKFFHKKDSWARGADVHIGFHNAAREVFSLVKKHLKDDYATLVTGHSLGASTAVLVGLYLEHFHYPNIKVLSFGQPRISNKKGAKKLNGFHLERIVHQDDLVTKLPPKLFGYRHFGSLFTLSGYKFAKKVL